MGHCVLSFCTPDLARNHHRYVVEYGSAVIGENVRCWGGRLHAKALQPARPFSAISRVWYGVPRSVAEGFNGVASVPKLTLDTRAGLCLPDASGRILAKWPSSCWRSKGLFDVVF